VFKIGLTWHGYPKEREERGIQCEFEELQRTRADRMYLRLIGPSERWPG
jgi:hypothetical protein